MTTATAHKVATITGTFLTPGVSSNGRLYTREAIGRAVARMQSAISDGSAPPITQLTSHGTDDVLQTVGRLTKVWQDPNTGNGKYESEAPPTTAGRDLATLAKFGYAQAVSISGRWVGDVRTEEHEGEEVETADDIDVARIDYVPRGGVTGARIDSVAMAEGAPLGDFRDEFTSGVKVLDEDVEFADPGLREDGKRRYRLDNKANALQAWSYLNQPTVIEKYKPADLKQIRANVTEALKEFGVKTPTLEVPIRDGACPTCAANEINETAKGTKMSDEEVKPVAKEGISDADVAKIGAALVPSLAAALKEALKPAVVEAPAATVTTSTGTSNPVVAEFTISPAPAPVAETEEDRFARYFEARKAEVVAAVVKEHGLPTRTGFVANPDGSAKPLHEMSSAELVKASREVAEALLQPGVKYPGVNRNNEE